MARTFRSVGVVGLGTMGAGIAEVLARVGIDVIAVEVDEPAAARGREILARSTGRAVRKGSLSEADQSALLDRITLTADLDAVAGCELVIEAVPERMEAKTTTLGKLDAIVGPHAILVTNTSALSVTEIAVATSRPDRVVGMHWFNPAPVMGLIEVISTVVADPQVLADVTDLARQAGKNPVQAADRAGFIANALLFGYLNHALRMYESRYATREDIDTAMRKGCGHPMGPLALLDLIGLDTALEILESMHRQSGEPLHAPTPLLRQLVATGHLGRKTGRGLYTYDGARAVGPPEPPVNPAATGGRAREAGPS